MWYLNLTELGLNKRKASLPLALASFQVLSCHVLWWLLSEGEHRHQHTKLYRTALWSSANHRRMRKSKRVIMEVLGSHWAGCALWLRIPMSQKTRPAIITFVCCSHARPDFSVSPHEGGQERQPVWAVPNRAPFALWRPCRCCNLPASSLILLRSMLRARVCFITSLMFLSIGKMMSLTSQTFCHKNF